MNSKISILVIFLLTNFAYFLLHLFSKSVFISTILLICSIFSFIVYSNYSNHKLDQTNMKRYLVINLLILTLGYVFSTVDLDKDYRWFFPVGDNFGDSVKLMVMFDHFFDPDKLSDIKYLNDLFLKENSNYKPNSSIPEESSKYLNPYSLESEREIAGQRCNLLEGIKEECIKANTDNIYNYYSLPPLHILVKTLFAFILSILNNVFLFLLFVSVVLFLLMYLISKKYFYDKSKIIFIFQLTSYPFIFAILRGNFTSILTYLLSSVLLFRYFRKSEHNLLDFLLLAMIVNIRPTLILFIILFIDLKNLKETIKNGLIISLYIISIFFISLSFTSIFHSNYNLQSFLAMLSFFSEFNIYYQFTSYEFTSVKTNGFNIGLYPLLLNLKYVTVVLLEKIGFAFVGNKFTALNLYYLSIFISLMSYLYILILKTINKIDKGEVILKTSCIILLIGPFNGDYHLMLLLIPFIIFWNINDKNTKQTDKHLLVILLIFLIKPHSAVHPIYGISISTLVNSLLIFYLVFSTKYFNKKIESN